MSSSTSSSTYSSSYGTRSIPSSAFTQEYRPAAGTSFSTSKQGWTFPSTVVQERSTLPTFTTSPSYASSTQDVSITFDNTVATPNVNVQATSWPTSTNYSNAQS